MNKCGVCNKELGRFDFEYICKHCGKYLCWDCAKSIKLLHSFEYYKCFDIKVDFDWYVSMGFGYTGCSSCRAWIADVDSKIEIALNNYSNIETYSANYKGRIKKDKKPFMNISSPYFRERNDAENFLKAIAVYYGCNTVYDLEFEKDTASEPGTGRGTHHYTVWKAFGKIGQ